MAKVSRDQREVVVNSGGGNKRVIITDDEPSVSQIATNNPKLFGHWLNHWKYRYPTEKITEDL